MSDASKFLEQMTANQETTNEILRQLLEKQGRELELTEQAARDTVTQGRSGPGSLGGGGGPAAKKGGKQGLVSRAIAGAANFAADATDPFQASGPAVLEKAIADAGSGDSASAAITRALINKGGYREQLIELKTVEEEARAFGARANDGGIVPNESAIDARIRRSFKQAERRSRTQELVTERLEATPENAEGLKASVEVTAIRKGIDLLQKTLENYGSQGLRLFR